MILTDEVVARYFAPPREPLWRWSSDGTVITTGSGKKTIAFKQEVEAVIERLAPGGLPPFGAIVLLLASCRASWKEDSEMRGALSQLTSFDLTGGGQVIARALDVMIGKRVSEVLKDLDRFSDLDPELLRGAHARAFLADSVFEQSSRPVRPPDSEQMLLGLKRGIPPEMLKPVDFDGSDTLLADIDALYAARHVSNDTLKMRRETGLDEELQPAPIDEPLPERVRKLLEALRTDSDDELAGLARLALDLMAAVHVPRTLTQHEELPVGGYTDISNRGHLDRLLVSELAHDDDTLSVRVALNEALYLRRESPPRTPPQQRAMLLDSGVRMWGLPRVFGAAVALALAAVTDTRSAVRCFRGGSNSKGEIFDVDLTTREGLVKHLGALETAPDPGEALKEFLKVVDEADEASDAILVTHPDALEDTEFRDKLASIPDLNMYAASVDRFGKFKMLHLTSSGQTVLREAQFALESIFAPRKKEAPKKIPLRNPKIDPSLPSILTVEQFPFLLPHMFEPEKSCLTPKGVLYSVARDGRLLRRDSTKRGYLQLSDKVPYGAVRKVLASGESQVMVVIDPQQGDNYILMHGAYDDEPAVSTGTRCVELDARGHVPKEVLLLNDMLVMIHDSFVSVLDPANGRRLSRFDLQTKSPYLRWAHGRFFRSVAGNKWFQLALSSPGGRVAMIEQRSAQCVALVDRHDAVSPWALTEDGQLTPWLEDSAYPPIKFNIKENKIRRLLAVSLDGSRVLVEGNGQTYLLDSIPRKTEVTASAYGHLYLEPKLREYSNSFRDLRCRLKSVGISPNGSIVFCNQRGKPYRIRLVEGYNHIQIEKWDGTQLNKLAFSRCPRPPGARYDLSVARFADGSCIYLDSRGLLHLKSSDKTLPEMSLVLYDHHVTCWNSNGEHCGDDFFLRPGATKVTAGKFYAQIAQFTRGLK